MNYISFLQNKLKIILTNSIGDNVYFSSTRNVEYPYIIVDFDEIKENINIKNDTYILNINVKSFNELLTNDIDKLLTKTESIKNSILSMTNLFEEYYSIKNVIFKSMKINNFLELKPIWQSELNFNFTIIKNI